MATTSDFMLDEAMEVKSRIDGKMPTFAVGAMGSSAELESHSVEILDDLAPVKKEPESSLDSGEEDEKKRSSWKRYVTNVYFTYPKLDGNLNIILKEFRKINDFSFAIICRELHKDGEAHIAGALRFKKRLMIDSLPYDNVMGKPGHFETVRSFPAAVRYCMKDGDFIYHGDISKYEKKIILSKSDRVAALLRSRNSFEIIFEKYPGFCLTHFERIMKLNSYFKKYDVEEKLPWPGCFSNQIKDQPVVGWLNKNLFKSRDFKQKQLWLYGPTNVGKTHLVNSLNAYCNVYHLPLEDWYCDYVNGKFDLVVGDEFKGHKTVTFLNKFLEGAPMPLKKKSDRGMLKKDNPPVLILSNLSIRDVYSKVDEELILALKGRFLEIKVEERMCIRFGCPTEVVEKVERKRKIVHTDDLLPSKRRIPNTIKDDVEFSRSFTNSFKK